MRFQFMNSRLGLGALIALAAPISTLHAAQSPAAPARPTQGALDPQTQRLRDEALAVVRLENAHALRRARIDRLIEIYQRADIGNRVTLLERLRAKEQAEFNARLSAARQSMGTPRYERLRNTLRAQNLARAQQVEPERPTIPELRDRHAGLQRGPDPVRTAQRPAPRPSPDRPRP